MSKERFLKKIKADIHLFEIIKKSLVAVFMRFLGILFGYLFVFLVTKLYGAKAVGIYALSFTLLQIYTVIGKFGMDTAVLKLVSEYNIKDKQFIVVLHPKIIKLVIFFSSIVSIFTFFLAPYIASYIFKKTIFIFIFGDIILRNHSFCIFIC